MNRYDRLVHDAGVALLAVSLALTGCSREPPPSSWFEKSPNEVSSVQPRPSAPVAFNGCDKATVSPLIRIDQFGYRPSSKKVAILVDPVEGWNAVEELLPSKSYEVRSWTTGKLMFAGPGVAWNSGEVQKSSGDRGYWFDFSTLQEPGSYCIYSPEAGARSHRFEVAPSVYRDVLRTALKMFYFQRSNLAKLKPWACVGPKCWLAGPDYVGPGQDKEARSVKERDKASTARDLSGGWWDAGDTNKYVTFAQSPVHQLLTAYSDRPKVFGDDFQIPESGNGVPDILDELKYELDWLQKMQAADLAGGVLPKLGNVEHGDPVPEKSSFRRYYYPQPCSSATVVTASIFAHAALVFRALPQHKPYAENLQARAVGAWRHFQSHPRNFECDDGTIKSGDSDKNAAEQEQASVVAAIYLFALTGEQTFREAIAKSFRATRPMQEDRWSSYDPEQGDALLFYSTLQDADPAVKTAILERKLSQAGSVDIYGTEPARDLYRAFMRPDSFHWGHNMVRANVGNTNYDLAQLKLVSGAELTTASDRAEALLQSFHGVNALGIVYLTNMYAFGAENSVNQIYHAWYRDGDARYDDAKTSELGPAPGYVPGGLNPKYCADQDPSKTACAKSRLRKQPVQKAYLDFNTAWEPAQEHDRSWEITEPGIYYQAAYVKLLSKFVD